MIASQLQRDLTKEIGEILRDLRFKDAQGKEVVGANGYYQQLPTITEDDDDSSKFFPYYIVRIQDGETKDDDDPWTVTTNILLGIYDDDPETNGHFAVLGMIQRITDRFAAEPLLNGRYRANQDINWALQDEDTYPFYFGGIEIKFSVPKIERRDPYA
nr:hypothetical protein [uncultured Dysosmobacter sp.]